MSKTRLQLGSLLGWGFLCLFLGVRSVLAQGGLDALLAPAGTTQKVEQPFLVQVTQQEKDGKRGVKVSAQIAAGHYLYQDSFIVKGGDGKTLTSLEPIPSKQIKDIFSGHNKNVYNSNFTAQYLFDTVEQSRQVTVEYMGCNEEMCFMPEELTLALSWEGDAALPAAQPVAAQPVTEGAKEVAPWKTLAETFTTTATASGAMDREEFIQFLDSGLSQEPGSASPGGMEGFLARWGLLLTIPLIILLGIGLNLTPCVLPMIPINLAIIGAGVKAGSKAHGFLLGGVYGLGMALAYGALGLAVVLAGTTFGTINSSPWFNFGTAIVFVILALAMFDVFTVDLSRFQGHTDVNARTGMVRYFLIFGLGGFSALLAGACVAPALISVLLISTNIYNAGNYIGLLLPFLLGVGMALPWPVAGAGIGALPKPGMWMTRVKQGFGILILFFAIYYGYEGYSLWKDSGKVTQLDSLQGEQQGGTPGLDAPALELQLQKALQESQATGKPIFLDFWATWCKSCIYMERTTFSEPEVSKRLGAEFIVLKLQCEQPQKSPAKEILSHYQVMGLPTYLILKPEGEEASKR